MPDDLDWLKSWVAENNTSATQEPEHAQKVSELRDLMATGSDSESAQEPPHHEPVGQPQRRTPRDQVASELATGRKPTSAEQLSELRDLMAKVPGRESVKEQPEPRDQAEPEADAGPTASQRVSELLGRMTVVPDREPVEERSQPRDQDRESTVSERLSELRDRMAEVPGPELTREPSRRQPRSRREWDPASDQELTACMRLELSAQKAAARESAGEPSRRKPRGERQPIRQEPVADPKPTASQRVSELRNLIAAVPDRESAKEPSRRKPRDRTRRKPAAESEPFGSRAPLDDREPATDRKPKSDRKSAADRDPASRARDICLNLLTARPRTRSELRQALLRKEIPAEVADQVLSRLDDVGLIDDKAFAEMWVHSRHTYQGMGPRALAVELRRRGVDNDIAAEAVAAVDSDAEEERARQLVRKRLPSMSFLDQQAKIRRLVGMLARKGYSQGLAYRVVKDELANLGEDTNLLDTLD